ncbi:glycosyltransferase family 9 protein [Bdellovibrio svalbardensis]|uniref:Glycosyltransferase family 9 protein n=1 Tax=Bdellovibrio svalbardensis TaxID=2972972 RepID=A0ABT6DH47_9BACT|nr:glycosyltransferase family 9 protein [Bdellovibrio svalbardensis]MDG0816179.1 glycosyltransferase family 9 protein [Bdellovibrio svalbardensis]
MLSTAKTAKILIIRFSSFGDVVQTLSVPSALVQTFPGAEIHWITRKDMAPLLKNHPHIKRVWEFDRKAGLLGLMKLTLAMRAENFTHIYDAHNNMRSRVIVWILRPLGFLGMGPTFIRRSIRRWKRLLLFKFRINTFEMPFSGQRDLLEPLQAWGVSKIAPPAPQIFPSDENTRKAAEVLGDYAGSIALAPSAAFFLKRWPKQYWMELIQLLPGERFVLLGGPEDSFIEDIHAVAPDRVLNLAGKCSLQVSSSVVGLSKAIVSNDTGLLHVAEQLGKKTIALMGPAPFGFPSRPSTKIMELNLYCRPCSKHGQGPCVNKEKYQKCLVDITPAQVAEQLRLLLGDRP